MSLHVYSEVNKYKQSTLLGKQRTVKFINKHVWPQKFVFYSPNPQLEQNKQPQNEQQYQKCKQNGRFVTSVPKYQQKCGNSKQYFQQRFGIYGPNCVTYIGLLNRLTIFMIVCGFTVGMSLIALYSSPQKCTTLKQCIDSVNFTYRISIFNLDNSLEYIIAQSIIWLVLSIIIFIFMIYLRIYAVKTYKQVNNKNITESDYSTIIRRVPKQATFSDIQNLINNQIIPQIQQLMIKKQGNNADTGADITKLLKIQQIIPLFNMSQTIHDFNKEENRFKKLIKQKKYENFKLGQIRAPSQFSGTIIVIFNQIRANDLIHQVVRRSWCDKLISYYLPYLALRTQFSILGQKVAINRAPQPSDILWNNLGYSQQLRKRNKIIFSILFLVIVGASATVSYFLQLAKQTSVDNQIITTVIVVGLFIFNAIIQVIIKICVKNQRLDTSTNYLRQKLYMTVLHQTVNLGFFCFIIPFIIKYPGIKQGLLSADFPTVLAKTMLFFVFLTISFNFLIQYFGLIKKIKKAFLKCQLIVYTQHQAHIEFKGHDFNIQQKYADFTQLFWYGLIFAIISPVCIIIASIGFILFSIYERILFHKIYSIPPYTGLILTLGFINTLQYVIIIIGIVNFLIHKLMSQLKKQSMNSIVLGICIVNIILGFVMVVLPWDQILQRYNFNIESNCNEKNHQQQMQDNFFELTYSQANPAVTHKLNNVLFNQKMNINLQNQQFHKKLQSQRRIQ